MTDSELNKIVKLCYNQFLEKTYDFHGITLRPVLYDGRNGYEIFWEIENKNNLSCSETTVTDFVHDLIREFSKFVSTRDNNVYRDYWKRFCKIQTDIFPRGNVYISDSDREELIKSLTNISELNFRGVHCDIDFYNVNFENSSGEDFYIGYDVVLSNMSVVGELVDDFSDEYKEGIHEIMYHDDFSDYQFDLMLPFTNKIIRNPLLFDKTYMYITNDFIIKDKKGKTFFY
jgi:hypothetical protein